MIEIYNEQMSGVPVLHVIKSGDKQKPLPTVFFLHGFTSAKEHNLHFAYLLALKGFRVILPDAIFHGERSDGRAVEDLVFEFWDIITTTIGELGKMRDELVQSGLATGEIGVIGTSMGGMATLGSLTQHKWIQAAVCLMGSPNFEAFARDQIDRLKREKVEIPFSDEELEKKYQNVQRYDLSMHPEKLAGRPLLFWHGKNDSVVPFQPTYDFYLNLQEKYSSYPNRLNFLIDEQAEHKVTREALLKTVEWLDEFLMNLGN